MTEELISDMQRVMGDEGADPRARKLAEEVLVLLQQRVFPSPRKLALISKLTTQSKECSRYANDGSCAWLRKHGIGYNLPVPPIGQKAMCCFAPSNFTMCPGFRKLGGFAARR